MIDRFDFIISLYVPQEYARKEADRIARNFVKNRTDYVFVDEITKRHLMGLRLPTKKLYIIDGTNFCLMDELFHRIPNLDEFHGQLLTLNGEGLETSYLAIKDLPEIGKRYYAFPIGEFTILEVSKYSESNRIKIKYDNGQTDNISAKLFKFEEL